MEADLGCFSTPLLDLLPLQWPEKQPICNPSRNHTFSLYSMSPQQILTPPSPSPPRTALIPISPFKLLQQLCVLTQVFSPHPHPLSCALQPSFAQKRFLHTQLPSLSPPPELLYFMSSHLLQLSCAPTRISVLFMSFTGAAPDGQKIKPQVTMHCRSSTLHKPSSIDHSTSNSVFLNSNPTRVRLIDQGMI